MPGFDIDSNYKGAYGRSLGKGFVSNPIASNCEIYAIINPENRPQHLL